MRFAIKKPIVITNAINSANTTDNQIPSIPKTSGNRSTAPTWNTSVLKNEIIAEMIPLFNAVKKDEPKMLKPLSKNEIMNRRNAWHVQSRSSWL